MKFEIYEDLIANKERLDIERYCTSSSTPTIVIHGKDDTSVLPAESEQIANWLNIEPTIIEGAQHTFNSSHPWEQKELPSALKEACELTLELFQQH